MTATTYTTTDYYYYANFNTVLIFLIICILISSAIGIYRNAMWRARMDQSHVQVVYYRPGGGAASVLPAYPGGGFVVPNAPANDPPPPMPGSVPARPPTGWGKPPPYAAVA